MAADEPYHAHKHKQHGMNVRVVAAPDGIPLWFSRPLPGRTHDLTAARAHSILEACLTRKSSSWPTGPTRGRRHRPHPYYRHRELPGHYQRFNRDHARLRAPGERAFARLKTNLAHPPTDPILNQPHQPHRGCRPHTPHPQLLKMKEVH
ncbi:transposase family protein [Streptomyces netropsis]